MNAKNPALIIRGPAIVSYKERVIYSAENIQITPRVTTFDIPTSAYGVAEQREATALMEVSCTPVGKIDDAIAVLFPHRSYVPGQLVHHTKTLGAINTGSNQITITAHGFRAAAPVRLASFGVLPAGLDAATLYYLRSVDANTITLHTTEADAGTGANAVDITSAGTGKHRIIEQETLRIQSMLDGETVTLHNACITKMPQIFGAATKTALGEVTWSCYPKHASAPDDEDRFYTWSAGNFTDNSFDPADVITEPYTLAWGAVAPWDDIGTKEGCTFEPTLNVSEVLDDAVGIVSHQIDSIEATLTARPNNISAEQFLEKRRLQGAGAGRGRRLTGDDLDMAGSELFVRLYAASIDDGQINYDGTEDRLGDVRWRANRRAAGGTSSALFYIGAAAPV